MSTPTIINTMNVADKLIRKVANIQPHERVLIIADTDTHPDLYNSLAAAARLVGCDPTIAIQQVREGDRTGCTPAIAQAIQGSDVVFTVTNVSVTHSPAIQEPLRQKKIRTVAMATTVTTNAFTKGGAAADVEIVHELTQKIAKILTDGKQIRITTELGTDLTASIEGRTYLEDVLAHNPGDLATHPAGEAWGAPIEGTSEGVVVLDTMLGGVGILSSPITYRVEKGRVVSIEGGNEADKLKKLIDGVENADNIAEIALGTNYLAGSVGINNLLEAKHILGSVHVAIGDNILYGGNVHSKVHLDGVINKATVEVDGIKIFENGEVKIFENSEVKI